MRLPVFFPSLAIVLATAAAADEATEPNRLIHESSPYLLQHAYNPVDWYPWGTEAFEKARSEGKPIFLSIGYSTCHWCHVMEKESFSDPGIAKLLNDNFVSVKVDREERPDVDALYQAFLAATGGDGGWPANIFLTPELEPFFGGTYFPPKDREGRLGLETILDRLSLSWTDHRGQIESTSAQMLEAIESFSVPRSSDAKLDRKIVDKAFEQIAARHQARFGGFSPAPKFPQPVIHELLLRVHVRRDDARAARLSLDTLRFMASGGIYDQIGGGFHRYSVDDSWLVPHFEKMLYDQAQLVKVYLSAHQLGGDETFGAIAAETLDFVRGSLTSPQGGFYSALDATSLPSADADEKLEGAYYTWTREEIESLVGEKHLPLIVLALGVRDDGNVPSHLDPSGELKGRNIVSRRVSVETLAERFELPSGQIRSILDEGERALARARAKRPAPHLDDKVLAAWNGLMIGAFARGGVVLDDQTYTDTAVDAARFLESELWDPESGTLWRRWRNGDRGIEGFAEDYAFTIHGLIDLWETTFDIHWLDLARILQERQDELFWNRERNYYSFTAGNDESILLDVPGDVDSVLPSHNSVSAMNLLRLGQLIGKESWIGRAREIMSAFGGTLSSNPQTMPLMVSALSASLAKPKQIIVAGERNAEDTKAILSLVHSRYLPDRLLILADGSDLQERLTEWMPFMEYVRPIDVRATAYVCENFVCKLPSNDLSVIERQLDSP